MIRIVSKYIITCLLWILISPFLSCAIKKTPKSAIQINTPKDDIAITTKKPILDKPKATPIPEVKPLPQTEKKTLSVVAVLPLYTWASKPNKLQKNQSEAAVSYLQGLLSALDTLKLCGVSVQMRVFEQETQNPNHLKSISDSIIRINPTVVIAPFREKDTKILARYLDKKNIPLYMPVSYIDTCADVPLISANANHEGYANKIAELVKTKFTEHRIFLINENTTESDPLATLIYNELKDHDSLKVLNGKNKGSLLIEPIKYFSPAQNVVIIPSRNEIFITSIVSQMMVDSSQKSVFIGLYPWLHNRSLDATAWEKFNFHILTPYWIDYQNPHTKRFVQRFRSAYNSEPEEMSFRGYDDLLFLSQFNTFQISDLTVFPTELLHNYYQLIQDRKCPNTFRNQFLQILEFKDSELNPITLQKK